MTSAQADIDLLDRVLLRIASAATDDEMENQLGLLLCPIILKFSSPFPQVKTKLMELFRHINEILQNRPQLQLPIGKLITQYTSSEVDSRLKSFTSIYIRKGMERLSMDQAIVHCASLLKLAQECPEKELPYRYGVPLLPYIITNKDDLELIGCEDAEGANMHTLLDFVADFLRFSTSATQPTIAIEGTSALPPAPPGLSRNILKNLVVDTNKMYQHTTRDAIISWKKRMLSLLCQNNLFPQTQAVTCVLVGAGDANTDISEFASNTLRRLNVDADDAVIISFLTSTVIQSPSSQAQKAQHPDNRRTLATPNGRLMCMNKLLRSKSVYNDVAVCLKCVFSAINSSQGSTKLIVSGLDMMKNMIFFSPSKPMEAFCPILMQLITKIIDDPSHAEAVHARAFNTLGLIARHNATMQARVGSDFSLLRKLFNLATASEERRATHVQDALNLIRDCYRDYGSEIQDKIVTLLLEHITHPQASIRSVALKYAIGVFPGKNVRARFVTILACGDDQHDVRESAIASLEMRSEKKRSKLGAENESESGSLGKDEPINPSSTATTTTTTATSASFSEIDNGEDMYDTSEMIVTSKEQGQKSVEVVDAPVNHDDIPHYVDVMVMLGAKLLHEDIFSESRGSTLRSDPPQHASYKHDTVVQAALLFAWRCVHLSATRTRSKEEYISTYGSEKGRAEKIRSFLIASSSPHTPPPPLPQHSLTHHDATLLLSELCISIMRWSTGSAIYISALDVINDLFSCVPNTLVPFLKPYTRTLTTNLHSPTHDMRTTAAKVLGHYYAACGDDDTSEEIAYILKNITETDDAIALNRSIGCCHVAGSLFALLPSDSKYFSLHIAPLIKAITELLENKRQELVCAACATVQAIMTTHADSNIEVEEIEWGELVKKLISLTKSTDSSKKDKDGRAASSPVPEAAVSALGCLANALAGSHPALHQQSLLAIYNSAQKRLFEMNLTAGDALTIALAGENSVLAHNWAKEEVFDSLFSPESNEVQQRQVFSKAIPKRAKTEDRLASGLDFILEMRCMSVKASERHAAAVWLVAFCKHCATSKALHERLPQVQLKLLDVLSEGDDIMQEVASHGLELCYDLGTGEMKKTLVSALSDALAGGHRSKSHKFTTDSDDVVFDNNELGKTKEGGNLSTYRELTALAADLNQPDLIYRFMALANHNILWNSRRGAAYGFGRIMKHTGISTIPSLQKIIPKLYRYKFDPNPRTRTAMMNIWDTIVSDPIKAVDTHFHAIVKDLLEHVGARQWRVRESSGQALAEILRGRTWSELKSIFLDIWKMAFRVIDDVKETVRKAGVELCKRLLKLSTTLCAKPDSGHKVIAQLLPFITDTGLVSKVDEVKSVSLAMIIAITKDAGQALKPHLTTLILTLLEALSGLESPYLDYVGQRLSAQEGREELLDNARMAMSKTSPIAQCLSECVMQMDASILPEFVPQFINKCKHSLGASTKAGYARVPTELVRVCGKDLSPFVKDLLKVMLNSATVKSAPLRREFAGAIGELCKVASSKDVNIILKRAKKFYYGTEEDIPVLEKKEASALACRAIARSAPDIFSQHLKTLVPLSFFGKHDESTVLRGVWDEVWAEASRGTTKTTVRVYAKEILDVLRPRLRDRLWTVKKQASEVLSEAMKHVRGRDVEDMAGLIGDILECMSGRTWTGKEKAVQACCDILLKYHDKTYNIGGADDEDGSTTKEDKVGKESEQKLVQLYKKTLEQCASAVLREASKSDKAYKAKVIPSLGKIASVLESELHVEKLVALIGTFLSRFKMILEKIDGFGVEEDEEDEISVGGSTNDDAEARKLRSEKLRLREEIEAGGINVFKDLLKHSSTIKELYAPLFPLLGCALEHGENKVKVAVCNAVKEACNLCNDERYGEGNRDMVANIFLECIPSIKRFGMRTSHSSVRQGIVDMCYDFQEHCGSKLKREVVWRGNDEQFSASDVLQHVVDELMSDSSVGVRNSAGKLQELLI
eukprot:m.101800 g.101800  ORF g.101800 m.101800 type:complete len:1977 (-) comp9068_c0_seq1:244-6174(-)